MTIMSENLYDLFRSRFPADRGRTFIENPQGRCWTYRMLDEESARYARMLSELGVRAGDRILVQVDKSPEALFLYLACLRAGLIYLPLNPAYQSSEIAYFLADAEPSVLVCRPQALDAMHSLGANHRVSHIYTLGSGGEGSLVEQSRDLEPEFDSVSREGDDVAALLYTSGTTGRAKGAMLSHRNLASNALSLHRVWDWRETDVLLHALPLFHVHGLFVACNCVLLNGTSMIVLPKFDPQTVLDFLPRATVFMGVPTYYTRLLAQPDFGAAACRNMRLFISGSAPLLEQTFGEFLERTGHHVLERYGMSETSMNTSNPVDGPRKPGTVGFALPGVDVRIVDGDDRPVRPGDVGEIQLKGPNVSKGYWGMPERVAEDFTPDGFFRSGDLGTIDEDGYVSIVGRSKDLVITGGYNVYPKEVEQYIDELDGIQEAAVIGIPDADFGEMVAAAIVRKDGVDDVTAEDIIDRLKQTIASYKVPKRVFFVDELPRNAMGKVQKNLLRERLANAPSGEASTPATRNKGAGG